MRAHQRMRTDISHVYQRIDLIFFVFWRSSTEAQYHKNGNILCARRCCQLKNSLEVILYNTHKLKRRSKISLAHLSVSLCAFIIFTRNINNAINTIIACYCDDYIHNWNIRFYDWYRILCCGYRSNRKYASW